MTTFCSPGLQNSVIKGQSSQQLLNFIPITTPNWFKVCIPAVLQFFVFFTKIKSKIIFCKLFKTLYSDAHCLNVWYLHTVQIIFLIVYIYQYCSIHFQITMLLVHLNFTLTDYNEYMYSSWFYWHPRLLSMFYVYSTYIDINCLINLTNSHVNDFFVTHLIY